jgi:uncharacterized protein YjbI with pentapeptide repeats
LAIPVVLAAAGLWFTAQQDERQRDFEKQRAEQAREIEDRRAEVERSIEEQRAQDVALQDYLDQMSVLLLEYDLRESQLDSEARTLARARTFAALRRLDPSRKSQVIQFLSEANLVQTVDGKVPVINLDEAGLGNVGMIGADLSGAFLVIADLDGAHLGLADLSLANLSGAKLRGAYLNEANLSGASLRDADLREANLYATELSGADLSGANLNEAYLAFATGVTNEELKKQAASLQGATMPNGQKYEDWLKSKNR